MYSYLLLQFAVHARRYYESLCEVISIGASQSFELRNLLAKFFRRVGLLLLVNPEPAPELEGDAQQSADEAPAIAATST